MLYRLPGIRIQTGSGLIVIALSLLLACYFDLLDGAEPMS